jgi:hypothetical protein
MDLTCKKLLGGLYGVASPLEKVASPLGLGLGVLHQGLQAAGDIKNGAPPADTEFGAFMKMLSEGGGTGAGAIAGGLLGLPFPGAEVFTIPAGAYLGGLIGEKLPEHVADAALGAGALHFLDGMMLDKQNRRR